MNEISVKDIFDFECKAYGYESYIYNLFNDDGICIYVGQTKNFTNRIRAHISRGIDFCLVRYEIVDEQDANLAEADRIVEIKPALNMSIPPTEKYSTVTNSIIRISDLINEREYEIGVAFGNSRTKRRWFSNDSVDRLMAVISAEIDLMSGECF